MKKIVLTSVIILISVSAFAQKYEPQLLILAPSETTYDKKLEKDVTRINDEMKARHLKRLSEQKDFISSDRFKKLAQNLRLITESEIRFSEDVDLFRSASLYAEQYLTYRFFERFPNVLILLSEEKSNGQLDELKALADKSELQYVLNFPRIEVFKKDGIAYATLKVQLYDNTIQQYVIDRSFTGDWSNPGFEFSCEDQSLTCTINNALAGALAEVIRVIAENNPTLRRERQLKQERYEVLVRNYLSRPNNVEPLKSIIKESSDELPLANVFQVLYDDTMTKFVAFSCEKVDTKDMNLLKGNKKDKSVQVLTSKDIKDKGFLTDMPQTYGFIIKGVKHEGKWYYEKDNATYFEASSMEEGRQAYFNNLQRWNFFEENSSVVSPHFWETSLFRKVRDKSQDPDNQTYAKSYDSDEANDKPYIGLYEIVADAKRKEKRAENEKFEQATLENKFKPALDRLKAKDPKRYSKWTTQSLIFDAEKKAVISPVLVTDNKGINTIHYFVILSGSDEVLEWTYFPTLEVKGTYFGSEVVDQMETITHWNFGYDELNDENFWNTYVLLKEGDGFKYLKKIL